MYKDAIQRGLDITREKPFELSDEATMPKKPAEPTGGGNKIPTELTEEEQLIKQTQLYQKLLGGDEARSQAVYDALLAASPAFFKGKNLREAAPEVLTAINKSGAFDKPRDIRQAAAQLSIQRAMLKDKAIAEERARLGQIQLAGEGKKDSVAAQLKELTGSGAIIGNITPDKLQQAVKDYPVGSNLRVVDPTTKRTSFIRIVSQKNSKGETIKSFEEYLI
jgi:DNA-binding TFAR19-related protein (PDSD5 family)